MAIDPPPQGTAIVGMGRMTLDVIVRDAALPRAQAGGTCGNVLAILAYLGWEAWPIADLGDDDPGRRFLRDLTRWGVRDDLIVTTADPSPVILHRIEGDRHSFEQRCPRCGGKLRYYEPMPIELVRGVMGRLSSARVFFFDRDSDGALLVARHYRERDAIVMYEPNYVGPEVELAEMLAVTDVLKYAAGKLPGLGDRVSGPGLVIETRGEEGLRYRRAGGAWHHLPAIAVPVVRDAAGAGDWTTAGFLHGREKGLAAGEALRLGQALAAWNCAFEGARGGMYAVSRERFREDVARLLAGERFDPGAGGEPRLDEAGAYCACLRGG